MGGHRRAESKGGEARRLVLVDGEIGLAKVGALMGTRRRGLGAAGD